MRSRVTRSRPTPWLVAAVIGLLTALPTVAPAQYFGRNKVQYEDFDFRIIGTPHFDVHFYPAESLAASDMARMSERWYTRLSPLMRSQFEKRSIILYANSPDFQQTNVVSGLISQATGGVTESLRGRVTMPLQSTFGESDHVLGHELVHVFQYNIAFGGDPANARGLNTIPLWVIEGMAEYLSVGRYDPLTAMWLRDALRREDLPTLKQLSNDARYFPYRYGQAFWAWFAGRFGDQAVERVYRAALRQGWEQGLLAVTGRNSDSLSAAWHRDIRAMYTPLLVGRTAPDSTGEVVIRGDVENSEANVSPVVSPDGRYVAFFSSRDLFGYALYVADVNTGRVIKRLTSIAGDPHFDAISFIASAGSWSPDGQKFAFIVYAEGDNELDIYDVSSGDVERRIKITGVGAVSDPAWSPDGSRIVVSGNAGGVSDLYMVELATGRTEQLTRGRAAELQPAWSPDGRTIAYTTDQGPGYDPANLSYGQMRLALLDVSSGQTRLLPGIGAGKHINPQFSPDGTQLYFVSDQDGFADIYRMSIATGESYRITHTATGVSGITRLSPAISVARSDGRILFSVFNHAGFSIRSLDAAQAQGTAVVAEGPATVPLAGLLPPPEIVSGTVPRYLADALTGLPMQVPTEIRDYDSNLSLDYVGVPAAGFGVSSQFGAIVNGAVAAVFADELNNRNVGAAVIAQGTLKDIGGQLYYLNREHRWNWLVGASRTPYLALGYQTTEGDNETVNVDQVYIRQFFDQASATVQYPFSMTRRVEFSAGVQRISYDFSADRLVVDPTTGLVIDQQHDVSLDSPDAVTLSQASLAYVGDYSFFGFTSPVAGARYHFEVEPTFGDLTMQTVIADYRHYFLMRPVTFAVRGLHYGRYGRDAEDGRLYPLFLGNPQLVRGYESGSFDVSECASPDGRQCPAFSRLLGSRIAVASAELRLPLFGTSQYGLINFPYAPTELALFADAGVAWNEGERPELRFVRETIDRVPVTSVGASARINVLGYAVVEIYYAHPFQRPEKSGVFGFQIAPGW